MKDVSLEGTSGQKTWMCVSGEGQTPRRLKLWLLVHARNANSLLFGVCVRAELGDTGPGKLPPGSLYQL